MLTYNKCYSLLKTDNSIEADIVMGGVSKQKCPYCESSYSNLLVLDGKDERLSDFGIKGKIKMKHFAQLSDKDNQAGGTLYVQICTDCQTAAVSYQQT